MPLPDGWDLFPHLAVSVLTVLGLDLGMAFLFRAPRESVTERD
jgi:hypothetical protein